MAGFFVTEARKGRSLEEIQQDVTGRRKQRPHRRGRSSPSHGHA